MLTHLGLLLYPFDETMPLSFKNVPIVCVLSLVLKSIAALMGCRIEAVVKLVPQNSLLLPLFVGIIPMVYQTNCCI